MSKEETTPPIEQDISEQVDGLFKPLMQDGAIIMLRTLVLVAAVTMTAVTVPAVMAESQVEIPVEVQKDGFVSTAKNYGSRVFSSAKENLGKVFDSDARVQLLKDKEQEYLIIIARQQQQLVHRDIEVGVKHQSLAYCAREVADYLDDLQVMQEIN